MPHVRLSDQHCVLKMVIYDQECQHLQVIKYNKPIYPETQQEYRFFTLASQNYRQTDKDNYKVYDKNRFTIQQIIASISYKNIVQHTHTHGSTPSASDRRWEGDRFESRADTTS